MDGFIESGKVKIYKTSESGKEFITSLLSAGDLFIIPSNTVHSGKSISDCNIIDVFNPVREDYAKLIS